MCFGQKRWCPNLVDIENKKAITQIDTREWS